jgi:hypothetical protein
MGHLARTHGNAITLRRMLAQPWFLGSAAWSLTDEQVFEKAEAVAAGLQKAAAAISTSAELAGRRLARGAMAMRTATQGTSSSS